MNIFANNTLQSTGSIFSNNMINNNKMGFPNTGLFGNIYTPPNINNPQPQFGNTFNNVNNQKAVNMPLTQNFSSLPIFPSTKAFSFGKK
jgi:hypothetical protein